jgi:hypothetical protein
VTAPAIVVIVAIAMTASLWPFAVVLASRWSKSGSGVRRRLGRGCGGLLLYASFSLSLMATWGALVRPPHLVSVVWASGVVLLQPVGLALALLVTKSRAAP